MNGFSEVKSEKLLMATVITIFSIQFQVDYLLGAIASIF